MTSSNGNPTTVRRIRKMHSPVTIIITIENYYIKILYQIKKMQSTVHSLVESYEVEGGMKMQEEMNAFACSKLLLLLLAICNLARRRKIMS
jgi:hypothetical protein